MDASVFHRVQRERDYAKVIADAERRAFEWGPHDCVTFGAAAVKARTRRDVLAELGLDPTWRSALEAAKAIESVGGLRVALTRLFGDPVAPLWGRTGDIAVLLSRETRRELVGVVHAELLLAPGTAYLERLPITDALAVWRVEP